MHTSGRTKTMGGVKRFLLGTALVLLTAAIAAQLIYAYSGSNQWESVGEQKGVKVYSLKIPGSVRKRYKAVWKVRSTLSKFVMFAQEEESDLSMGYYDMKDFARRGDKIIWSAWKQQFPSPLQPREFVVRNEFSQDPTTKRLLYTVTAEPDKLPPNSCCVRVPLMVDRWHLTPLRHGEIEVEWVVDLDVGGVLPYFMQNSIKPGIMWDWAPKLQGYLDREKYKNAKYSWVEEIPQ